MASQMALPQPKIDGQPQVANHGQPQPQAAQLQEATRVQTQQLVIDVQPQFAYQENPQMAAAQGRPQIAFQLQPHQVDADGQEQCKDVQRVPQTTMQRQSNDEVELRGRQASPPYLTPGVLVVQGQGQQPAILRGEPQSRTDVERSPQYPQPNGHQRSKQHATVVESHVSVPLRGRRAESLMQKPSESLIKATYNALASAAEQPLTRVVVVPHRVPAGTFASSIASLYGVQESALLAANNCANSDGFSFDVSRSVPAGAVLRIPMTVGEVIQLVVATKDGLLTARGELSEQLNSAFAFGDRVLVELLEHDIVGVDDHLQKLHSAFGTLVDRACGYTAPRPSSLSIKVDSLPRRPWIQSNATKDPFRGRDLSALVVGGRCITPQPHHSDSTPRAVPLTPVRKVLPTTPQLPPQARSNLDVASLHVRGTTIAATSPIPSPSATPRAAYILNGGDHPMGEALLLPPIYAPKPPSVQ